MATTPNAGTNGGMLSIPLTGTASTTGGAVASVLNPEGALLYILRSYVIVDTPSTGSANINVGVGTATTTDATDMISALAVNGSITDKCYNASAVIVNTKTEVTVQWAATSYVNVTGSATTAGLVGTLLVEYVRA